MPCSKLRVRTIQFTFLPDTYKSDINPVGCIRVHLRLRSLFLICALNVIHSEISSETQLHFKKRSSVAYAYIPRRRKPRQEDCHKFKANLGYIVSSRSACYVELHSVLTTEGQSIGNGS